MPDIINTSDNSASDIKVVVNILYDPMRPEKREQYVFDHDPSKMLSDYLSIKQEEWHVVAINGTIFEGPWEDISVYPGDKIAVTSKYGWELASYIVFEVMVATMSSTAMTTLWAAAIYWTASAVVYAAIMYGVSYLCTALLAPDAPDSGSAGTGTDQERSPTYSWGGLQPVYTEGNPIPIIFGPNKVAGQVLNQYVEIGSDGKNYLNIMLGVGHGTVDSIEDIEINGRPASSFKGVTTYTSLGDNAGEVFPNFDQIYTHHNYNAKESGSGTVIETGGNSAEKIEIDLSCPHGCYYSNTSGGLNYQSAEFNVYYRVKDEDDWILDGTYTIGGAQTEAINKCITIDNLTPYQYEIKFVRTNAEINSHRGNNDLYLVGMREIIKQELLYPGIARYAIRAMATDQLSGQRPTLTCIVSKDTVSIYDEDLEDWDDKDATNPAWAVWYLFNHYGEYDTDKLDWDAFSQWAEDNDTDIGEGVKKAVYAGIIDTEGNLWDKANDIAKYGRAQVFKKGTIVSVFVDREDDTVSHVFSMGNIIEDSFILQYLPKADRANCIEITYTDPDRGYDRKIVQVKSSEYEDETKESIKTSISFNATLPRAQVVRDAAYRLNSNKWLIRAIEFNVDVEAFACVIGDLCYFQHDVTDYMHGSSGRIVGAGNIGGHGIVTLDHEVTLDVGTSYSILVRLSDDTIVEKVVSGGYQDSSGHVLSIDGAGHYLNIDGLGHKLKIDSFSESVTTSILELETEWATIPTLYDVFMFGETSNYKKKYRLTNVSRQDDKIMRLTGLEYIAEIYDDVTDYVIENPIWEQREQEAAGVWLNEYLIYAKDGGYQSNIGVKWHPAYSIDPVKWDVWIKDLTAEQVDGLVGSWLFNEGMGLIAYDSSGEGNDSTLVNTPTWTSNENGFALDFDGVDQYARTETIETIFGSSSVNTFSVSFWAKANDAPINLDSMLGSGNNSLANGFGVMWSSSTVARFFINNYSDNFASAEGLTATDWNHFVGVYDGSTIKIYVNTVIGGVTDTYSDDITDPSFYVDIGQIYNSTYNFDGLIKEVRIYNKAISVSEIEDLYALRPIGFTKVAETDNLHAVISAPWLVTGNEYQVAVTPSGLGPINTGSNHASIKLWGKLAPPENVTGFSAAWSSPGNKVTRTVAFSWNAVSDIDLSHYEIRDGESWADGDVVIEHATGTYDSLYIGEGINTTKTYWIAAVDTSGVYSETPASYEVAINTGDCVLETPTGLSLSSTSTIYSDGQDRAELLADWDDYNGTNVDYFSHYEIRLEHISSGHVSIFASEESHYNWELPPNTEYGVEVRAVSKNDNNSTDYCDQETQVTAKDSNAPATVTWPALLSIVPGFKCLALNWNDNSEEDLSHYIVERSDSGSFGGEELELGEARVSFFTDFLDLEVDTQYWYRIKAVDSSGNSSGWSSIKNGTTLEIGETDIAYNSITANHMSSTNISAYFASFGTMEAGVIQSTNWGASAGFKIDLDLETLTIGGYDNPDLLFNGALSVDWASITNVSIENADITNLSGEKILSDSTITAGSGDDVGVLDGADATYRIYAGSSTPADAPFRVEKDGTMHASAGEISGDVEVGGVIVNNAMIKVGFMQDRATVASPGSGSWSDYQRTLTGFFDTDTTYVILELWCQLWVTPYAAFHGQSWLTYDGSVISEVYDAQTSYYGINTTWTRLYNIGWQPLMSGDHGMGLITTNSVHGNVQQHLSGQFTTVNVNQYLGSRWFIVAMRINENNFPVTGWGDALWEA